MGKGKTCVKSLPPLLTVGEVLRERYHVDAMIGGGGFGQIFRGFDKSRNSEVAIKIEPPTIDKRRMRLEHSVLLLLRGKPHIPKICGSGQVRECSFIVMDLLGKNLSELRRREKNRKLSVGTTFRVAMKISEGLRQMHIAGYLHRDVKPSNCCIGRAGAARHEVYILDFGITRKFNNSDGTVRKAREYVGFRGTVRYASPTVHARREPGPGDDMIGVFYSVIELTKGTLPWTRLRDVREVEKSKLATPLEVLCENLPVGVLKYAYHVMGLRHDQIPDYELINTYFKSCWPEGTTEETPYDWETADAGSPVENNGVPTSERNKMTTNGKSTDAKMEVAKLIDNEEEMTLQKEKTAITKELPVLVTCENMENKEQQETKEDPKLITASE